MENKFTSKSNSQLRSIATVMTGAMNVSPTSYGTTAAAVSACSTANTTFGSDITAVANAKAAWQAAVDTQNANRKALIASMNVLAKAAYAKPVTDAQLAAAGLAIRDSKPTPIIPQQPTGLATTPNADGSVFLKWTKNNPYGVTYFIEASVEGGVWGQVYATKRGSITISGFAPGVETAFRVKAENRGIMSLPSNESIIYPASAPEGALRIAA
ncbi:MAG: fibronectin type III domain-containing protein [Fimbriimonadaceae bacterium]